jgi:NAD(P)-dependent dehydrogenase (short-subunit alcohol dehydrogenase family)
MAHTGARGRRSLFVTGAASGMGRETALLFAEQGWFVGAYDVNTRELASLEKEIGSERCLARRLDVTDKPDYDTAVREFGEATGGTLDLLYNNAGIGESGWFEDVPYEAALRVVQVNLVGVLNGIYAALPLLRATRGSLCFTTSSSSATFGMPRLAVYSATKHAVKGLTEALSVEFSRHGVRVACVLPGLIDTPILTGTRNHSADGPPGIAARESAPREGPFRLMPARSVAECVWQAYHDTTGRLHWYVPEEIRMLDQAKGASAETVRDQVKGMVLGLLAPKTPA